MCQGAPGGCGILSLVNATFLPAATGAELNLGGASLLHLDHIGIAVQSISAARRFYEALGLRGSAIERIEHEGVRTAMLSLGSSRLELIEPLSPDSVIGRFLDRRGEGLHHIAIHVEDIDAKFDQLLAAGTRLASDAIREGAGGHRYFFVHPSSAGGVLVEIVGSPTPTSAAVAAASDPGEL